MKLKRVPRSKFWIQVTEGIKPIKCTLKSAKSEHITHITFATCHDNGIVPDGYEGFNNSNTDKKGTDINQKSMLF